jgi:hypothetical protein
MQTFDQHMMDLVSEDIVDFDTAKTASSNPSDFELQMKTLRRRSRVSKVAAPAPEAAPAPAAPAAKDEKPLGFTDDLSSMLLP